MFEKNFNNRYLGNPDLVLQVQKEYFKQNQNNVTTLISTLIFRNWFQIIDLCNLSNWKELLSAIAVHGSDDEYYNYIGLYLWRSNVHWTHMNSNLLSTSKSNYNVINIIKLNFVIS